MASITVRDLDEKTERQLRTQAAENGRSIEEEARAILCAAVTRPEQTSDDSTREQNAIPAVNGSVDRAEPERGPAGEQPQYKSDLVRRIRAIVDPVGGIELQLPERSRNRPIPFLGWEDEEDEIDDSRRKRNV